MKDKKQNKKKIYVSLLLVTLLSGALINVIRLTNVLAWGPEDRQTYTMAEPADHAVFNSITDNSAIGDERNFVRVTEVNTEGGHNTYLDEVHVKGGKDYEVSIYYHNDASSTYNYAEYNNIGAAEYVHVATKFPDVLEAGEKGQIDGTLYWKMFPMDDDEEEEYKVVWDEAFFIADEKVKLSYIEDSAVILNGNEDFSGTVLPSGELFTSGGTLIGYNGLNGVIPGCDEYSGTVVYRVHAEKVIEPSSTFEMDKKISVDGGKTWADDAKMKPGDEAEFRITYRNTGTLAQEVTAYDTFESGVGMEYVPGSTRLVANGLETIVQDANGGMLFIGGASLGTINAGDTAEIYYKVKIKAAETFDCGKTVLYNLGAVDSKVTGIENSEKFGGTATLHDKVRVEVTREGGDCNPPELPPTGPAEVVLGIVVVAGLIVGIFYLVSSKITLNKLEAEAKGEKKADKKSDKKDEKKEEKPEEEKEKKD